MNLLVRNVIEREIKREKVQMEPPLAVPIDKSSHCMNDRLKWNNPEK